MMVVDIKLKAEDELLLSCARSKLEKEDEDRIISLLDNNLDWDYLINKATRNRLRPLLYLNLNQVGSERVPEDVLQGLKSIFENNARRNLMLTGELVKVMALLEDNGIKAITYKGPVLAKGAYGNLAYREFGDVDVFIDKKDALKVIKIMYKKDYELYPAINIDDSFYIKFVTEHRFLHKKSGALVEIKWRFAGDFFTFPVDSGCLTNEFIKTEFNGLQVNSFPIENQLLILIIHAGKHDWTRLAWIVDIAEYIKSHKINWIEILKKAENLGVKRILLVNMYLVKELWGLKLNKLILNQIDSDKSIEKSSKEIINRAFFEKDLNIFGKFFFNLKKRDRLIYGIKDSFNGLTKPGYRDFIDIPLPKTFFGFYYVLRPFLLIKRYGKDSV